MNTPDYDIDLTPLFLLFGAIEAANAQADSAEEAWQLVQPAVDAWAKTLGAEKSIAALASLQGRSARLAALDIELEGAAALLNTIGRKQRQLLGLH